MDDRELHSELSGTQQPETVKSALRPELRHLRTLQDILDAIQEYLDGPCSGDGPLAGVTLYAGLQQRAALYRTRILRTPQSNVEKFMGFQIVWVERDNYCRLA